MMGTEQLPLVEDQPTESRCVPGTLEVVWQEQKRALPLAEVAIKAQVIDNIAGVEMRQRFTNPYSQTLEAVYVFPLAGGAAVRHFEMKVGDRVIIGKVEERGAARRQYAEALAQGQRVAMMEQERDDVFTLKVGNIPPQEDIDVILHYSEPLPFFENGTTELRLPLVVAPRYIAGEALEQDPVGLGVESDTNLVPDASRITPPRLAPGFDPKINLQIEVEIQGQAIADLGCSQHAVKTSFSQEKIGVRLSKENELLNRDFVLRWRLAGDALTSKIVFYTPEAETAYGMLTLLPPKQDVVLTVPRDIVFILDRSGSMEGNKMGSASRACGLLLNTLGPRDRYAILAFDDQMEWFEADHQKFFSADLKGQEKGQRFLRKVNARGGTELELAMQTALQGLEQRPHKERRVPVIVLLTDGQIGDESHVLKLLQKELYDVRVFTVGIDTAVNEKFLRRLATLGGGTATFVVPGEQLEDALGAIGREIGQPLLTDIHVEEAGCGFDSGSLAPSRIPDLFAGRALNVFFRAQRPGSLTVMGKLPDGSLWSQKITGESQVLPALAQLWAKTRIGDLEDAFRIKMEAQAELKAEIIQLSCAYNVLTRFTAMIAIDPTEAKATEERRQVVQPVEMPDQWLMESGAAYGGAGLTMTGALPPMAQAGGYATAAMYPEASPEADFDMMMMPMAAPASPPPPSAQSVTRSHYASIPGGAAKKAKPVKAKQKGSWFSDTVGKLFKPADKNDTTALSNHTVLKEAIMAVLDWFKQAQQQLQQGDLPDSAALEQARQSLLQQLAQDELADQLPQVQRFLRREVVEWLAALDTPGVTAAHLQTLWQQHSGVFSQVQAEMQQVFGEKPSFWEASI